MTRSSLQLVQSCEISEPSCANNSVSSQDVRVAHATQLNPTEQDTLVKQIGLALLRTAPGDWQRITAHYRTVGRYHELEGEVTLADGSQQQWVATQDIATLFNRLRAGMYREERGTWFNAHYQLDAPASYNLEYDREEPRWRQLPPPQAYTDELRMFPRNEENIPEWLMDRLSGVGPEPSGPHFRFARIFDGTNQAGRPVIERQELNVAEQDRMLSYLGGAPVVLPGRGYDLDRLAPVPEARVPVAFHSDGTWIWPAAVNYYLQEYGIAPEAELVEHIRNNGFQVPRVTDEQRAAAHDYLTRGDPGQQQATAPQQQPPAAPEPRAATSPATTMIDPPWRRSASENGAEEPPPDATERTEVWHAPADLSAPPPDAVEQTQVWQTPVDVDAPPEDVTEDFETTYHEPETSEEFEYHFEDGFDDDFREGYEEQLTEHVAPSHDEYDLERAAQASISTQYFDTRDEFRDEFRTEFRQEFRDDEDVAEPVERELAYPDEPAVTRLRDMLADLNVPSSDYSIGEPVAHGWSIEQTEQGWRVGWYDDTLTNPSVFGDAEDAAAFMLGKLLLEPSGSAEPEAPAVEEHDMQPEVNGLHRDVADALSAPYSTGMSAPAEPQPTTVTPPVSVPDRPETPPTTFHAPAPRQAPAAPGGAAGGGQPQQTAWPVQPLPGEPPLTLFRGKQMEDLPIGTEIDRFGYPDGNLTYTAGTPFEERSLVPEWVHRPYHVYRVQRPIEALAGVSIPWFSQPGGGSAYVLPAAIEDLVADGVLIELDPGDPPTG